MSLGAWGDEGSGADPEILYARGWESNPDCTLWWRKGEPEETFSFAQACQIEEEWDED